MFLNRLKGTLKKKQLFLWRARQKMFNWMFLSVQKSTLFLCQRVNTAGVMATSFALRYAIRLIVFVF